MSSALMRLELLVNDFAIRSFRDIADGDYIAARIACEAALVTQFLWASQQAMEKYLKCILLLNRVEARKVRHNLGLALEKIQTSGKLSLDLTRGTRDFIKMLDDYGPYRYLEVSNVAHGAQLVQLDRAVWELRRYCTLERGPQEARLRDGFAAPLVRLPGGSLEKMIDDVKNPARKALIHHNAFFGKRTRKRIGVRRWLTAHNAPLYLNPQILDEVLKYVFIPKELAAGYRSHTPQ
jgi:HEPN domain-containing protein